MLKKFTDGLVFGSGFAIAFIAFWYVAAYFIFPMFAESYTERFISEEHPEGITYSQSKQPPSVDTSNIPDAPVKQFHELDLEEQIKLSSVIALAEFIPSEDGKMKAIITEFIKKQPDAVIYYNVGDEHTESSFYPRENTRHGDGLVIFFTGSPAKMKMSMTYSGERIMGLGDMPMKLLRQKCEDGNA